MKKAEAVQWRLRRDCLAVELWDQNSGWTERQAVREANRLLSEPLTTRSEVREPARPVLVLLRGGRPEPAATPAADHPRPEVAEEPAATAEPSLTECTTLLDITKRRIDERMTRGGAIPEIERDVAAIVQHHLDRYSGSDAAALETYTEAALAPMREPAAGHELPEDPELVPFDDVVRIGRSVERIACPPDEVDVTVRAMLRRADRTLELPTRRARRLPMLTEAQVRMILERTEWKRGDKAALAAELGVSAEAISKVVRGISHQEVAG